MVFDQNRLKNLEEIYAEKQRTWKSDTDRLQNELKRLRDEQMNHDPEMKVKYLQEEVKRSEVRIRKKEEDISSLKSQIEEHANTSRYSRG